VRASPRSRDRRCSPRDRLARRRQRILGETHHPSGATERTPEDVERAYDGAGYGDLKRDVGEAVVELLTPVRERYLQLRADEPELLRLLASGADKARVASAPTLAAMYERMGFVRL